MHMVMAIAHTLFCVTLGILPESFVSTTFAIIRISPCRLRPLHLWRIRIDSRGITRRIESAHVAIRVHSRRGHSDLGESRRRISRQRIGHAPGICIDPTFISAYSLRLLVRQSRDASWFPLIWLLGVDAGIVRINGTGRCQGVMLDIGV